MEPEMPAILPNLPNSVLTSIFNKIIRISNPGQLVKLSLACRSLREAVVRAEGLWERLCVKQGWSQRQRLPRPLPPLELAQPGPEEAGSSVGGGGGTATAGATATAPAATPAAQSLPLSLSDLDLHWYLYYARRMMLRRDVRPVARLLRARRGGAAAEAADLGPAGAHQWRGVRRAAPAAKSSFIVNILQTWTYSTTLAVSPTRGPSATPAATGPGAEGAGLDIAALFRRVLSNGVQAPVYHNYILEQLTGVLDWVNNLLVRNGTPKPFVYDAYGRVVEDAGAAASVEQQQEQLRAASQSLRLLIQQLQQVNTQYAAMADSEERATMGQVLTQLNTMADRLAVAATRRPLPHLEPGAAVGLDLAPYVPPEQLYGVDKYRDPVLRVLDGIYSAVVVDSGLREFLAGVKQLGDSLADSMAVAWTGAPPVGRLVAYIAASRLAGMDRDGGLGDTRLPSEVLASGDPYAARKLAEFSRATEEKRIGRDRARVRATIKDRLRWLVRALGPVTSVVPGGEPLREEVDGLLSQLEALSPTDKPLNTSVDAAAAGYGGAAYGGGSAGGYGAGGYGYGAVRAPAASVDPDLLGEWRLVYASNAGSAAGAPSAASQAASGGPNLLAQVLQLADSLPGFGMTHVLQRLSLEETAAGGAAPAYAASSAAYGAAGAAAPHSAAVVVTENSAVFRFGPLGSWRVTVKGRWMDNGGGMCAAAEFESFGVRPVDLWGLSVEALLPEVTVPVPEVLRSRSEWCTTYLDEDMRVGRGSGGALFLFRRGGADDVTEAAGAMGGSLGAGSGMGMGLGVGLGAVAADARAPVMRPL
eukprot:XP_001697023.1 predicted protein [Chlamydomonas reinhardtii]